ncbi:MAG: hypothetical protein NWQ55_01500, partial [Salibacteraceae bacterium]|nr:hypothetical protein [Salibacteraceae bacterium]
REKEFYTESTEFLTTIFFWRLSGAEGVSRMIFLIALALELDFEVKSPLCPSRYSLLHKLLDVTEIFALKSRDLEINLNLVLFVHSWHSLFNTNLFWRLHFDCAQWTEPKAEVGQFL